MEIKGDKTLCFSVKEFNCEKFDSQKSFLGSLFCDKCNPGYYLTNDISYGQFSLNQCVQIPVIDKCEKYQKANDAKNSQLLCEKCEPGYFIDINE